MPEPDRPVMTVSAVARDVDVDALEVVLARAADGNVGQHRIWASFRLCSNVAWRAAAVNAALAIWVRGLAINGGNRRNGSRCAAAERTLAFGVTKAGGGATK